MATESSQQVVSPPPGSILNFAQLVSALESGDLNSDATRELERLVRELNDQLLIGRKATASIAVKITLTADRGIIDTSAGITVTEPKKQRGRSILYIANGQYLSTRDSRQSEMPFRTIDPEAPSFRTVG